MFVVGALLALTVPAFASSALGTWTATANMATPRAYVTATPLASGRVLVIGGAEVSTAEVYDPATASWLPAGTLSEPAGVHVAVRLADGRVLVAGGGWYSTRAEIYDPATNSWSRTGSMNVGRISFTGTLLQDGRVLVVGWSRVAPTRAAGCEAPRSSIPAGAAGLAPAR